MKGHNHFHTCAHRPDFPYLRTQAILTNQEIQFETKLKVANAKSLMSLLAEDVKEKQRKQTNAASIGSVSIQANPRKIKILASQYAVAIKRNSEPMYQVYHETGDKSEAVKSAINKGVLSE